MQAQDRPGHLLSLKNIRKTFGGIRALKGVSLSLDEGEVLALVGENGAGKSTLVKVLTGIYHPEEGQINVRGSELVFDDAHAAGRAGIAAVHQETVMFDELSVAENIYMGRQPMKKGVIDWATMNSQAQVILPQRQPDCALTCGIRVQRGASSARISCANIWRHAGAEAPSASCGRQPNIRLRGPRRIRP